MVQHHYNLSSGSNLNPECPLPTVPHALESASSMLNSYFIYFLMVKLFFEGSSSLNKTLLIHYTFLQTFSTLDLDLMA